MTKAGPSAWLMYLAVRSIFAIMQVFPMDWNLKTARVLARIWKVLMPRHYDRAVTHLSASLGDRCGPEQIRRIAHRCLESVTMFAVEVVCLPRLMSAQSWSRCVRLVNFDDALHLMLSGKGLILVTGHYGSFELMGHLLANLGMDVAAVMRPLDNVYLNRFVVASRRIRGLTLLDKKGAMATAQEKLRDGTLLCFVGDQDAGRKGLFVDFFGQPASTYKSIALLAVVTGAPVVIGYARRCGRRARYEVGVKQILYPEQWESQDDPIRWITQAYTAAIEAIVREEPEQYLWIHRRWKSKPRTKRPTSAAVASPAPA